MLKKRDIVILTASFGTGHIAVAKVIKAQLLKSSPNLNVEIVDIYKLLHPRVYKAIYRSYSLLAKYLPYLYNQYYYGKEKIGYLKKLDTLSKVGIVEFKRFIKEKNPMLIISTFPSCTGYVAQYKRKYNKQLPLFTCITDVVSNNEWLYEENDHYFVADRSLKVGLIEKGIADDSISVTGIPIRSRFIMKYNKDYYKRHLGYSHEDKIVLLMGGGLGLLPKDDNFYKWLVNQEHVQVVALTSSNERLYNQLKSIKASNFRVYGYCEKVSEYMAAADVLIGKSGGITLYEAIASSLPIIVYKPKLGQEIENCRFIIQKGIGYIANNEEDLKYTLKVALKDEIQEILKDNIVTVKKNIDEKCISEIIISTILTKN